MKTSEAKDQVLNYLVAKCLGERGTAKEWLSVYNDCTDDEHYTTDWAQGGPIIERERIATWGDGDLYWEAECGWAWAKGPTPLIAAMRCYVTLKLGDEVEVPDELKEVMA